jgi:hypothetical protein
LHDYRCTSRANLPGNKGTLDSKQRKSRLGSKADRIDCSSRAQGHCARKKFSVEEDF